MSATTAQTLFAQDTKPCRKQYLRGELYRADLRGAEGSEQSGIRPVLVIQNDIGNRHAPTVIVVPATTQVGKSRLPTHVTIEGAQYELPDQVLLCEQIRTLDKFRLLQRVAVLTPEDMERVKQALRISIEV